MSVLSAPFKPPKSQNASALEPSWEIAKLFPYQGQWSEAAYLAIDTNRLVELSQGNIKVIEMATQSHLDISTFLFDSLRSFVQPRALGKVNYAPLPVKLWSNQFREPDVQFMLAEHSERRHEQYWEGADLVMEIVSEDRAHDLEVKRSEYAQGGVAEYWIIDPKMQEITVLSLLGDSYKLAGIYHRGDKAKSALLIGFEVDVTAVLDAK
jgi:Uma2 family endonuclease